MNPNIPLIFEIPPNEQRKEKMILENKGEVGRGGFGVVYKVSYEGKDRALKVIEKNRVGGKNLNNVKSEINIIQAIEKAFPNCVEHILCYIDIAEDENNIYLLSDLMDTDYFDFIISDDYMNMPMSKKIDITYKVLNDLLDGLKMLHSIGVIHRDLKPENFLWNRQGPQIKIADFGLSCFIKECKGKVGSLAYVSPFIYLNKEKENIVWTTRDDLYSLASVIYSALTGRMYTDEDDLKKAIRNDSDKGYENFIENAFQKKLPKLKTQLSINPKGQKLYMFLTSVLNPFNDHIWSVDEIKTMIQL